MPGVTAVLELVAGAKRGWGLDRSKPEQLDPSTGRRRLSPTMPITLDEACFPAGSLLRRAGYNTTFTSAVRPPGFFSLAPSPILLNTAVLASLCSFHLRLCPIAGRLRGVLPPG